MTISSNPWRPEGRIRAKAIAIAKRNARILVCEVLDDNGDVIGWVPIDLETGSISFSPQPSYRWCSRRDR